MPFGGGHSGVNFLADATLEDTAAWWRERTPLVADGTITGFAAVDGHVRRGRVVGSTLLIRSRKRERPASRRDRQGHRPSIPSAAGHRPPVLMAAAEAGSPATRAAGS